MSQDFFHDDMRWFLQSRVDWDHLFRLQGREGVSVPEEVGTYVSVLETLEEI